MSDDATRAVLARYTKQVDATALDVTAMAARIAELERVVEAVDAVAHIDALSDNTMYDGDLAVTELLSRYYRFFKKNAEATHD